MKNDRRNFGGAPTKGEEKDHGTSWNIMEHHGTAWNWKWRIEYRLIIIETGHRFSHFLVFSLFFSLFLSPFFYLFSQKEKKREKARKNCLMIGSARCQAPQRACPLLEGLEVCSPIRAACFILALLSAWCSGLLLVLLALHLPAFPVGSLAW